MVQDIVQQFLPRERIMNVKRA